MHRRRRFAAYNRCVQAPLATLSFTASDSGEGTWSFAFLPDISSGAEYYELDIAGGCVQVRAVDYAGVIHAIAVLSRLLIMRDGVCMLPDARISDCPDSAFRSFMLDPARNLIPMDEVRATVIAMARAGLNKLHLHLSDGKGFAFLSEAYPDLPVAPGGAYTREELDEIISLCSLLSIDVIPEIDVPAHSYATVEWKPSLKCRVTGVDVSSWNLCLGNEEVYALIDTLLSELARIFPYEYIHIGTDEMDMRDILDEVPLPRSHCEECETCRTFFSPMGLDTLRERFYYFVRRVHATVTSLGKRVMMWNDDIDISKDPDIPHDILIEFWRVAAEERGPVEGCSMQGFLDAGFDVINADFPNTYLDEYVTFDKLCAWNPKREPAIDVSGRIKGGEMCLWEGSNYPHFLYAAYFALPLFGDRLWNCDTQIPTDSMTLLALSRAVLGPEAPEDFDLFAYLRGVPLGNGRFMEGKIFGDGANLETLKRCLTDLAPANPDGEHLVRTILGLM